ncbi:MAG: polysaccharide deacetylase family protein [Bacillota bacterium]
MKLLQKRKDKLLKFVRQRIGFIFALVVLLILLFAGPYIQGNYFISAVSQTVRLLPVYEVDTPKKQLSISFDASWGAEKTEKILDILDKYEIKTTFFLVNIWINDYPEMAREIASRGHEIGLHSVTHPNFTSLTDEQITQELNDNYQLIKEVTGQEAVLFRPPFGDYNNNVIEKCQNLGFMPIQWSIDSLDWKDLSATEIEERVMKDIGQGDIVLFHNNGKHTAEALDPILKQLTEEHNLEIVPISELLLKDNWYVDYNGVQRNK